MSEQDSKLNPPAGGGASGASSATVTSADTGGRYTLTITDPENKRFKQLTISIDIEDHALKELRATDADGNSYEVNFRVKRPGRPRLAEPQPAQGDDPLNPVDVKSAVTGAPASGGRPGKEHGDDDDQDEDDDECQCCKLVGGQLKCEPCPCPKKS